MQKFYLRAGEAARASAVRRGKRGRQIADGMGAFREARRWTPRHPACPRGSGGGGPCLASPGVEYLRWSAAGLGAIVAGTDFLEIMEVRLRIEPQMAQLAALRAKAPDVERLYELVGK